jgi:hypothetical protein
MRFGKLKKALGLHRSSASKAKDEKCAAGPQPVAAPDGTGTTPEGSHQTTQHNTSHVASGLPLDTTVRELWNTAFEKLREEDDALVQHYEAKLRGDLSAGLGSMLSTAVASRREQMNAILRRKMDEVNRETWKFRLGTKEFLVKDLAQPALAVINRVNGHINGAVASNPCAAIAWAGVSVLLPVRTCNWREYDIEGNDCNSVKGR